MKTHIILILLLTTSVIVNLNAQSSFSNNSNWDDDSFKPGIELKTAPFHLLLKQLVVSTEYRVDPKWGVELGLKYGKRSFSQTLGLEKLIPALDTLEDILDGVLKDLIKDSLNFKISNASTTLTLAGKHYFVPRKGTDAFFVGLYSSLKTNKIKETISGTTVTKKKLSLGLKLGYKWVAGNNFIIEASTGVGRAVYHKLWNINILAIPVINWDTQLRLDIGYRF